MELAKVSRRAVTENFHVLMLWVFPLSWAVISHSLAYKEPQLLV